MIMDALHLILIIVTVAAESDSMSEGELTGLVSGPGPVVGDNGE